MSLRVYLNPSLVGSHPVAKPNPGAMVWYMTFESGAKVSLYDDNGLFYFTPGMLDPINPKLAKLIQRVTHQSYVTDRVLMAAIKTGYYKHGKFEAEVTTSEMNQKPIYVVNAKTPTISLMKRFIRQLMAGELEPKVAYGKPREKLTPAHVN